MVEFRRSAALMLLTGWAVSLVLPVAEIGTGPNSSWPGFAVLLVGWMAIMFGQFGWLANPLLLPALLLLRARRVPRVWGTMIGAALVVLAVHSFDFNAVQAGEQAQSVGHLGPGYFLWSAVMAAAGALLAAFALIGSRAAAGDACRA